MIESRMPPGFTLNRKTPLHRGGKFDINLENVTLPNDVTVDMEVIRHPGAAAIVPVTADGSVLMVRQFRYAVGRRIWEIPAGTVDNGEAPLACARRELLEEAGVSAGNWEKLCEITPVPGYSDERIHIYLASDLTAGEQHLDRDEILDVHSVPLEKALEMIHTGEIEDGKTIAGLFMAVRRIRPPE